MNNMSTDSIPITNTPVFDRRTGSLESSLDESPTQVNSLPPLLPRSAWNSQVAFLRVLFVAKKALDRIEKAHIELR